MTTVRQRRELIFNSILITLSNNPFTAPSGASSSGIPLGLWRDTQVLSTLCWGHQTRHHALLLEAPKSRGSPHAVSPHVTPAGGQGSQVSPWAQARLAQHRWQWGSELR